MKICVPVVGADRKGMDEAVYAHFGSAPWFAVVDTGTDSVEMIENGNMHDSHGNCHPLTTLEGKGIDAVVTGGMGRRAIMGLNAGGIRVYLSQGGTVREIVEKFRGGGLAECTPDQACAGHGHGEHAHGEGHAPGHGHHGCR